MGTGVVLFFTSSPQACTELYIFVHYLKRRFRVVFFYYRIGIMQGGLINEWKRSIHLAGITYQRHCRVAKDRGWRSARG